MTAAHDLMERRTRTDVVRGLGAAIALVAFVVGVPIALVALAPTYLPHSISSWGQLWDRVLSPDDGTLLLAVLAAVAWITWASFSGSVLIEVVASARRVRAPSVPLLGGMQHAASRLLATAGLLLATASSISVHAPAAASALVVPVDRQAPRPAPSEDAAPMRDVLEAAPAHAAPPRVSALPTVTVKRGDTLWDIAEHHLGDPMRYTEIRELNLGRTQPDGRQLKDADWVLPGWVLLLPSDAVGAESPVRATRTETLGDRTTVVRPGDTLWKIAAAHLGSGGRYSEIVDLNQGNLQPDGGRLAEPDLIQPGWVLRLPADAREPGAPPTTAITSAPETPAATSAPPPAARVAHKPESVPSVAAAPSPGQVAPPSRDASDRTQGVGHHGILDDEERSTNTWFLGFAALGAVGIVGEIARRRHLQQRARKIGETIPLPAASSPAAAAERTLRAAAPPVSIEAIRIALTNLASRCFDAGRDLPRIGALLLGEQRLRLVLVEDAPDAVAPFTAQEPRTWVAETAEIAAAKLADDEDEINPYPLLVVLGHTDDATVILNLEAAGTLSIFGDDAAAEEALRALVMEAATSDLASQLAVHVDEPFADLAVAFEDFRLRPTDARDDRGRLEAEIAAGIAGLGHEDTLQLRSDRDMADLWLPYIYVEHALQAAPSASWSSVVTITRQPADPAWTITIDAGGSARLEPLGIDYRPQRLTAENAERLGSVLVTSVPPEPRRTSDVPSGTLAEEVVAVGAATPAVRLGEGAQGDVSIDVLGPIQFRGLPPTAKRLTPRMKELLVYLALHGPTAGPDLEDVLWDGARIQHGTRGTLVYRTRDRVGEAVLPKAADDGTYQLGPRVTTDWARFQRLTAGALANSGQARVNDLTAALALVRDRPLRGIGDGQFPWADYDIQEMTSAVADAAHLLARMLHESGRHREALDAAMRGLGIEPFSEPLQQQAIAATEAAVGTDAAQRLRQRFSAEMARLDPELA